MKCYKLVSKKTGKELSRHFKTIEGARTHKKFVNSSNSDYRIIDKRTDKVVR